MELFPFVNHTPTHVYPKGDSFQFGGGYEHSAAPQGPLQRRFTLHFNAMVWYPGPGGTYDAGYDVPNNILALDNFYAYHRTHLRFMYDHPVYGMMYVKFAADVPFEMPKSIENGGGVTEGFTLVLVEQPT